MRALICGLALLAALVAPAWAQSAADAKAVIEEAYAAYDSGDFPEDTQAIYSSNIKTLWAASEERSSGELGALDFDPFINGQDWDNLSYSVQEPVETENGVTVTVDFSNFGIAQTNIYTMVHEADGWKIDEIEHKPDADGEGWLLSQILASDPTLN